MVMPMHYSVMRDLAIENLNLKDVGIYVDATLGYAGHSKEILKRIKKGFLFAFDADIEAIQYSRQSLLEIGNNFKLIHSNFINLKEELKNNDCECVDGFLFDLGLSSPEIDNKERGFSFMQDALLDMRMDRTANIDAKYIVNNYSLEKLSNIFFQYAEKKRSRIIAEEIVKVRKKKEITRTLELVEIIKNAVGANYFFKKHPEREIFQALRIEVNNELKAIEVALEDAIKMLNKGGRIVVITFHSLEDRIVKNIFRKYSEVNEIFKGMPNIPEEYKPLIKIINKKPYVASEMELKENSRSKSAKMRVVERI